MDTVSYPLPVVRSTLKFLEFTNRWFGGSNVILGYLKDWSRRWERGRTIHILDVGCGAADIPLAIAGWAAKKEFHVLITALDTTPEVAEIARERSCEVPTIQVVNDDVFSYLSQGKTFDYITASLLFHHLSAEQSLQALQTFDRCATRGLIISDLLRSWNGYVAVSLLSRLTGNTVVRHDGPLSVRRAFQPEELQQLAHEAGLPYLHARVERWFRVSLAGEKLNAA